MNRISILYGSQRLESSFDRGRFRGSILPATPTPNGSSRLLIDAALRNPIGSARLEEIAAGKRTAAILIPGKARIAATQDYVPALIDALNAGGIRDENIEIFLADGTHVQNVEDDVPHLLREDTRRRVRCLGHDCRNHDSLVDLGVSSRGTPLLFNRRVIEADVRILTGRIVPHYFAGYSGGRKALLPGVAGFPTIVANHRLTLAPQRGIHEGIAPCRLCDNPVHLDMLEASRLIKPEFSLNTILDADHHLIAVCAGDVEAAHAAGCKLADQMLRVHVDEPLDAVIASAGGLPYDYNFMQAMKVPFNVRDIVRPGGALLWIAEAADGIHDGFSKWAAIKSDNQLDEAVRADYALTGHNSILLRKLVQHARVAMFSALLPEKVSQLGIHPVSSLAEGLSWIADQLDANSSYAVVPHANVMCATANGDLP